MTEQPGPGRGNVSIPQVNKEVQSQGLEAHVSLVFEKPGWDNTSLDRHLEGAA